jgi:hypothetical protein
MRGARTSCRITRKSFKAAMVKDTGALGNPSAKDTSKKGAQMALVVIYLI